VHAAPGNENKIVARTTFAPIVIRRLRWNPTAQEWNLGRPSEPRGRQSNRLRVWRVEKRRAKSIAIFEGRQGARHTGKIVAVLADEAIKRNIVVLDVGRELGLVYVDRNEVSRCRARIGEMVVFKWTATTPNQNQCWHLHRIERTTPEPQLER
jgi:hypothetical protein